MFTMKKKQISIIKKKKNTKHNKILKNEIYTMKKNPDILK